MGVARILWGHREVVEDILKREIELEKSLSEDPRMDPVWVAMEREQVAEEIEWRKGSFQSMTESLRELFVDLYGGLPESTLQRLMSIEPHVW
jgi:DNA phosphorothioation-dependent restriction protein DptG